MTLANTDNGSNLGGVDADGDFIIGFRDGAYERPAIGGAIYTIAGTSGGILTGWQNGFARSLFNPSPHPVMKVNLMVSGSVALEVNGGAKNAQLIDDAGQVRDDHTVLKGTPITGTAWAQWQAEHFLQSDLTDPTKENTLEKNKPIPMVILGTMSSSSI